MEKLIAERDAWKNASLAKDKLLAVISHDLKGQLSGFQGLIELLSIEHAAEMPSSSYPYLDLLRESSSSLSLLLENLLQWARLQTWAIQPQYQVTYLRPTLAEICQANRISANNKKIALFLDCKLELKSYTDNHLCSFIVRNLVANAIKYTPPGGEVRISAVPVDHTHIKVEVTDNGKGIPEEILKRLFTQQDIIPMTGTAQEKGTGLGLMLCLEFAQLMGSSLHIHSELESGTTTSFFIQLAQKESGSSV